MPPPPAAMRVCLLLVSAGAHSRIQRALAPPVAADAPPTAAAQLPAQPFLQGQRDHRLNTTPACCCCRAGCCYALDGCTAPCVVLNEHDPDEFLHAPAECSWSE